MIGSTIGLELRAKDVRVIRDSQLVLQQLTREYKCNNLLLALGSAGEMHQFSTIMKLILLPLYVGKLRISLRTWLFVDTQAAKPL